MILRHGLSENEIAVIDDLVKENGTSFAEEFRRILSGCDESKFSGESKDPFIYKTVLISDQVLRTLDRVAKKHKMRRAEVIMHLILSRKK